MQSDLPDSVYAFPKQRKKPLTDAQHVRSAVARFDQVTVHWRSRTSRKLQSTTASTSQKRHGTTCAFTPKKNRGSSDTSEARGYCHPISAGWCGREVFT